MAEGHEGIDPNQQDMMPGKAYKPRPFEYNGDFYDGFHPPKLVRNPDGTESYVGGRKLEGDALDEVYAEKFWNQEKFTNSPSYRDEIRRVISEEVVKAAERGRYSFFVSPDGFAEGDKARLSATRLLAKQLGYSMGKFVHNAKDHLATAPLTKVTK